MSENVNSNTTQVQQHLAKVSEALAQENRQMKLKMEEMEAMNKKAEEERNAFTLEKQQMEQKYKEINSHIEKIRAEKKQHLEGVVNNEIKPYLNQLVQSNTKDDKLAKSVEMFNRTMEQDLDSGAFMNDVKESNIRLVHAMASAGQMTSSKLDEIFQARKEWEAKMTILKQEKEEQEQKVKQVTDEKEKAISDLQKELSAIRSNINNVEGHFKTNAPVVPEESIRINEQPQSISATASKEQSGYDSLYSIKPISWRNKYSQAENVMTKLSQSNY